MIENLYNFFKEVKDSDENKNNEMDELYPENPDEIQ